MEPSRVLATGGVALTAGPSFRAWRASGYSMTTAARREFSGRRSARRADVSGAAPGGWFGAWACPAPRPVAGPARGVVRARGASPPQRFVWRAARAVDYAILRGQVSDERSPVRDPGARGGHRRLRRRRAAGRTRR